METSGFFPIRSYKIVDNGVAIIRIIYIYCKPQGMHAQMLDFDSSSYVLTLYDGID